MMAVSNPEAKTKHKSRLKIKSELRASTLTLENLSSTQSRPRNPSSLSLVAPPAFTSQSLSSSQATIKASRRLRSQSQELKHTDPARQSFSSLTPTFSKGKEKEIISLVSDDDEDETLSESEERESRLWTEIHQPTEAEDLAVHKRKVQDVRQWLIESFEGGMSGALKQYRRILALTGPAGSGKTATIRALSRELEYDILEWATDTEDRWLAGNTDYDSISEKFDIFLRRSSSYDPIMASSSYSGSLTMPSSFASTSTSTQPLPPSPLLDPVASNRRRLILVEDLPNIAHLHIRNAFHESLARFVQTKSAIGTPLVIVVSDEGRRAAETSTTTFLRAETNTKVDVRLILPKPLLDSRHTTVLKFNPIAPTLLKGALYSLVRRAQPNVFGTQKEEKEMLEQIAQNSNGDIRSAVTALEFICKGGSVNQLEKGKKPKRSKSARSLLETVTQRENSLTLFHLLGKVLYNKRKGDPSSSSASAKEIRKEREAEALLPDPPPLPGWFSHEERRSSKVDPETLYTDSPIDTSLYSLYLHQNYPKFCVTENQCFFSCDWLSYVDSMGSSGSDSYNWTLYINPYQFHLVTLGILHSLPSPVPRRSQNILKSSFFEWNAKRNEAASAADEVAVWLDSNRRGAMDEIPVVGGSWGRREVICDTGAVLKAKWAAGDDAVPESFKRFAELRFIRDSNEVDGGGEVDSDAEERPLPSSVIDDEPMKQTQVTETVELKSWLEEDDIVESDE